MAYMTQVFATVQWGLGCSLWWAVVILFGIDTLVVSRALNWFITDIRYRDILPVVPTLTLFPCSTSRSVRVAWPGICIGVISAGLGSRFCDVVHHVL